MPKTMTTDRAHDQQPDAWSWNLERLRELTGRTQQDVATGSGLGRTTIWRLERSQPGESDEGPYGIKRLTLLYRYFWRQGKFALDGQDAPSRRVTLCDILLVPGLAPCRGARPEPLPHVRPVKNILGVWWNIRPLRLELNARPDRARVSIKDLAAALGQTPDNLGEVEGGGGTGSVTLLVRAARYFAQHLRPEMSLEDVLIILPRPPALIAETSVSAT